MPRERTPEAGLALIREGYDFIAKRCRKHHADAFVTRLMLQETICMTGREAARLFYDGERFQRTKAAPIRVKQTLFGLGAIQGLDGEKHHARKQMLVSLLTDARVGELAERFEREFHAALPAWERQGRVVVFPAVRELILRAVCGWAGVPLAPDEASRRANLVAAVIEGSGGFGPRHWRGQLARKACDAWMGSVIHAVRAGKLHASPGSAVHTIAHYREPGGETLFLRTAGVELFNVIRPTVAVDRFITFAALALHQYPHCRDQIAAGTLDPEHFVQEVRRFYPFFPFAVARVKSDFDWNGWHFPRGRRVLLDIYGTDHDPRIWEAPGEFRPERFRTWDGDAFNFIPHGGGDVATGHRCPGERATIELMKVAVRVLVFAIRYDVPPQDLRISLRRMPAIPKSRFVIENIRQRATVAANPGGA